MNIKVSLDPLNRRRRRILSPAYMSYLSMTVMAVFWLLRIGVRQIYRGGIKTKTKQIIPTVLPLL
jgi:hypothetical protein